MMLHQPSNVDVVTFKNVVCEDIEVILSLYGFAKESWFDLEPLWLVAIETNRFSFFENYAGAVREHRAERVEITPDYFDVVADNPFLQLALSDFGRAIRSASMTAFSAYRACEALMRSFLSEEERDAGKWITGWTRFRDALRVQRSAIDRIKQHADDVRHGNPRAITGDERDWMLRTADTIIWRYLELKRAGVESLPTSGFDMLG